MALFDPLTGLPSRRQMMEALDWFCIRQRASGEPSCIAFMDLDNFKSVNDKLGHQEGDRCLVAVANVIRGVTRTTDLLCRFGGDEFVILMPDCAAGQAEQALSRLHDAVRRLAKAEGWEVGLSIGAVPLAPGATEKADNALKSADSAMYAAKRSSKSMIVLDGGIGLPSSATKSPSQTVLRLVTNEPNR